MQWDIDEEIKYYKSLGAPSDQTELINLLKSVQAENGGSLKPGDISYIADVFNIKENFIKAVIRRIGSLKLENTHELCICSGPNCSKKADFTEITDRLPGNITVKYVPCMHSCKDGPNIKWDGKLYNKADKELIKKLTEI